MLFVVGPLKSGEICQDGKWVKDPVKSACVREMGSGWSDCMSLISNGPFNLETWSRLLMSLFLFGKNDAMSGYCKDAFVVCCTSHAHARSYFVCTTEITTE